MSKLATTLLAACLGLASASVIGQTVAPPAGGSSAKGSTAVPPQNPAAGTSSDGKPLSEHPAVKDGAKTSARTDTPPEPTGKDSMAKDNMPKHPAVNDGKNPAPKQ